MFPRDIPAIYIVFESAPLEDPAQFSAQWFQEGEKGALSSVPLGKDTLEVPGHERYGFLELKKPGDAWDIGTIVQATLSGAATCCAPANSGINKSAATTSAHSG